MKPGILLATCLVALMKIADAQVFSYLDVQGPLYTRENLYTLNKAGNGWISWATRNSSLSETKIDLSNINNAFFSGNVGIGAYPAWSGYKLSVYNPGSMTGIVVGNTAAGFTSMLLGTSADTNGSGFLQAIKNSGSSYG